MFNLHLCRDYSLSHHLHLRGINPSIKINTTTKHINNTFWIFNSPWAAQMVRKFPRMQQTSTVHHYFILSVTMWSLYNATESKANEGALQSINFTFRSILNGRLRTPVGCTIMFTTTFNSHGLFCGFYAVYQIRNAAFRSNVLPQSSGWLWLL